jgi:two-component system, cell cycle sensor histidine kinase and response regulator CckA
VTQLRRSNPSLAVTAEAQFQSLLDAAPDAMVCVDTDGTIVYANAQVERLFGYPPDELLGQLVDVLVPVAARDAHPAHRAAYVAQPRPRAMGAGMELSARRRDGTEFPAEISLNALRQGDTVLVAAAIRDVTDRTRAEAKFRGLLEAAPDAIVGVRVDGEIALVNAQAERLFGYSREELIGQPVEMLVPEAARDLHPGRRAEYVADPRPRPMGAGVQLAGRRRDGTSFPAEISLSAIETEEGVLVSAAIRDVTDRTRAAAAQAQLAAIIQSSHDAIIGKTLDGTITSWNPGAERLYGYTAEQMIGANARQTLIPPHRRADEDHMVERIVQGEKVQQYQGERVRRDGTTIPIALTMSPIVGAQGEIIGIATVSRDLSEQQRADARFRALLEAAPDATIGVDAEGRIVLVNAQAEHLFGYARGELTGQHIELLVPEAARAVHPAHRSAYFADPRSRPMGAGMQLAARRRDGSEFPAEISLSALETDSGLVVSASVRDVSERIEAQAERERLRAQAERERLESQLHQSQRLESLGQLAGGVAHDFNNLLAVILNYASFVTEEVTKVAQETEEPRWAAICRDTAEIERAAERARVLTRQLLTFARRAAVRPSVLDLHEVVTDVEQLLRRTLGEHVELLVNLAPSLGRIVADRGQIEQLLLNLAVNARDAMPKGGTLSIDADNVTVDEAYALLRPDLQDGEHVRLRVSDTGTGMDRAVLAHAFEPFFTTKPKGEGSGLGLATVYGIVAQAGGQVQLYSEPGLGTTVTVLFPATAQAATRHDPVVAVPATPASETVLIVEDEDAMREVTRRILSRNGYRVLCAASGAQAMEIVECERGDIQLLVTDVIMPQMLGKEVAERVTLRCPDIRVLFMSGYAEPVLGSQGTLAEGVLLLEKPFSEPTLLSKVREALDAAR